MADPRPIPSDSSNFDFSDLPPMADSISKEISRTIVCTQDGREVGLIIEAESALEVRLLSTDFPMPRQMRRQDGMFLPAPGEDPVVEFSRADEALLLLHQTRLAFLNQNDERVEVVDHNDEQSYTECTRCGDPITPLQSEQSTLHGSMHAGCVNPSTDL